jgi:hypothetical protein
MHHAMLHELCVPVTTLIISREVFTMSMSWAFSEKIHSLKTLFFWEQNVDRGRCLVRNFLRFYDQQNTLLPPFLRYSNECLKQSSGTKHHRAGVLVKD